MTFAVIAFQASQRVPVRVAHTLHAPAHVAAAVRRRIPTLVTIRDPEAAVLSAIIREPYVTAEQGLRAWIRFYTHILPYRNGFVLGMFDEIVADYGRVIRQLNEKFGTDFDEFVHSDRERGDVLRDHRGPGPPPARGRMRWGGSSAGSSGSRTTRRPSTGTGRRPGCPRSPRPASPGPAPSARS